MRLRKTGNGIASGLREERSALVGPDSVAEQVLGRMVIAIDGPAGSGKTTTARGVARALRLRHLDTGAMYRAVTLKALLTKTDIDDAAAIGDLARAVRIEFEEQDYRAQRVVLDGHDVTDAIRSPEVTRDVSRVSSYAAVRRAMVRRQRALADRGGVVLEGRDIGSVVLPSADVKIYLDATVDTRAERRQKEFAERGVHKSAGEMRADIERRDHEDSTREVSPLTIPVGAHIVDTTGLTIDGQIERVVTIAQQTAQRLGALVSEDGYNPYQKRRFHFALAQTLILLIARLLWGHRVIKKEPDLLCEPYIIASNHRSNVDPPIVGVAFRREIHFIAKEGLFTFRPFGALLRWVNAFPVRKGKIDREALERCVALLERGQNLMIFPEGGRVKGEALGKPRPGVGYLAINTGVAVVPCYAEATNHLLSAVLRRPRITIVVGRPIRLAPGDRARWDNPESSRAYSKMVLTAIEALRDELHER